MSRKALMLTGASLAALSVCGPAPAVAAPVYAYQQTIQIPGATATNQFTGYDLSTFDASNQLYYLTDRSNNGIDVFSAATNKTVEQIGSGLFAGTQGGNNNIAGPNGISLSDTATGKLLIAGNGLSNLISFNLDSSGLGVMGAPRITSTAVAGTPTVPNRVDGVAYAPGPFNTVLAANNASTPGFVTLIDNATGVVKRSILLNGTGGYPDVGGNGVEATIFNTATKSYFIAIPAFNAAGTGAGGAIELDAATGNLIQTYDFNALGLSGTCSPTGLVQGAGASMFVACSDAAAGHSVVLDPAGTGKITTVAGISGGDQAAFDPTLNLFYEAARFQLGGPVLGIIDATTDTLLQTLAIGSNDHAVSVDPVSNEVFVATGPTAAFAGCSNGCIGVFAIQVPEPATLPIMAMALAGLGIVTLRRRA